MINRLLIAAARIVVFFLLLAGLFKLLDQVVGFATLWPWWAVPLLGALSMEFILQLYRYEKQVVTPARGRWLTGLRIAALLLLCWILLEPVWSRVTEKTLEKEVVILIDDSASMHLTDEGATETRQEIAEKILADSKLLSELEGKVKIRRLKAARRALGETETALQGWDQATDLAEALDTILEQTKPDNLGGVVLLSDGRHNGTGNVDDLARRFGILDAPIASIATGSIVPPKDAAILSVNSPDAVYLGDRVRVSATLKFDGYKGKKAVVKLLSGDQEIGRKEINVPQDLHREEVRFQHLPDQGGIGVYKIEIEDLGDERFADNNAWDFETAVTDARTNVLIVDSFPRWEFRYLRNLFYGRDKSINLQYILTDPDKLAGQGSKGVFASASRDFGDSQADRLPENEDEWRKFDVIILGDIDPAIISPEQWGFIDSAVKKRAALLVLVAGPRFMPHALETELQKNLVPVEYQPSRRTYFGGSETFKMGLTTAGKNHPVTAQVDGSFANEALWNSFPDLKWRHPIDGLREGAEVLLAAQDQEANAPLRSAAALDQALADLALRRQKEIDNALLVTRQTGNGKVAVVLTDRTWRLREGVGDTYHHRFWGQLVRWGAGPILRSGTPQVRLSTDQLTYTGDDKIQITARLRDKQMLPVNDDSLQAEIYLGETKVKTVPLAYVEDSNGLHSALIEPLAESGEYEIRLAGSRTAELLESADPVTTNLRVIAARSPVELSETTLNLPLLENIAKLSGGQVYDPNQEKSLASLFLDKDDTREELRETTLWDRWYILLPFILLLGSEWSLRRNGGLP